MNMGAQCGGFVTASLTPMVAGRFGWTASFLLAAALCVVGALAWLLVDPEASLAERRSAQTASLAVPKNAVTDSAKALNT
jgi:ACS family glucarate transporter-like MFS transporter